MSSASFRCQTHGLSVAYIWNMVSLTRKEVGCRLCSLEKNKAQKEAKKPRQKKAAYKIPYEYKCAPLSGCIPIERYGYLGCHHCIGKWDNYQLKYLLAFKPQPYRWEWNQI